MEMLKDYFDEEVNTPAVGYFWKGLALFLLGVIVGFCFAPVKKGMKVLSGNTITNTECCCEDDEDCCKDKDECCKD